MISTNNQRPPEPKVAGSNLAWRAENSPVVTAQGDTETRENARPGAAVNTNRRQSDGRHVADCCHGKTVERFLSDLRIELFILTPSLSYSDDSGLAVLQ